MITKPNLAPGDVEPLGGDRKGDQKIALAIGGEMRFTTPNPEIPEHDWCLERETRETEAFGRVTGTMEFRSLTEDGDLVLYQEFIIDGSGRKELVMERIEHHPRPTIDRFK